MGSKPGAWRQNSATRTGSSHAKVMLLSRATSATLTSRHGIGRRRAAPPRASRAAGARPARNDGDRPRRPLRPVGGIQMVRRDDRPDDRELRGQRQDVSPPPRHRRPALRALAEERAAADRGALGRGTVHGEGGGCRLRARRLDRVRARRAPRPLAPAPARLPPVHRRLPDDPDPRRRADGRHLVRREVVPPLVLGLDHRRLPHVLPGRDQNPARAHVGRPAGARAHSLVRLEHAPDPLEAAASRFASVPVHRLQDLGDGLRGGRDNRRAPRLDPERSRRRDSQLQPVLLDDAREPVGDEPRRRRARDRLLPGRRRGREDRGAAGAGARGGDEQANVVELKAVSKEVAHRHGRALEGIDLEIRPREFISLIGPSGCGKSTLLRIVGDLIQPSGGDVVVNGKSARQARLDRDYGIVFQDAVLFDWRTVEKNIGLPLEILRWDRRKRGERVQELVDLVELNGFEKHHPWQLSGGMQQRVSIARALSFSPPLLLMDEPFGALDEMTRERLNLELLRIWEQSGSTVIFVTHSISEAVFLSTRVVVMSARPGRIVGVVYVDLPQPRTIETREDPFFADLIREVRRLLREGGGFEAEGAEDEEQFIVAEEGL